MAATGILPHDSRGHGEDYLFDGQPQKTMLMGSAKGSRASGFRPPARRAYAGDLEDVRYVMLLLKRKRVVD